MADGKNLSKTAKPARLSTSASYKIGGKSYNSQEISHFRPQIKEVSVVSGTENLPRQVGKVFENQSGVVHTDASVSTPNTIRNTPSGNVYSQEEAYKPSMNTQAVIQTSTIGTAYKLNESTSINPTPVQPYQNTNHIQTGSEVNQKAEASVQRQVEYYHSNNAYNAEKTEIKDAVSGTPRTVESVKTSLSANAQNGVATPNIQTNAPVGTQTRPYASSPSIGTENHGSMPIMGQGSGSFNTGSQIASVSEQRVQSQVEHYHSNNAYNAEKTGIKDAVSRTPRTVESVKTSLSANAQNGVATPNIQTNAPVGTQTRPHVSSPSLGTENHGSMPIMGQVSGSLKTGSQTAQASVNSVKQQTSHFQSNNAYNAGKTEIKDAVSKMPRTVDSIKTSNEIADIKLLGRSHYQKNNSTTYTFECNVQGKREVLTYTVSNYGEGARGFSIHTQDGNLAGSLSHKELKRLDNLLDGHAKSYEMAKGIGGHKVNTASSNGLGVNTDVSKQQIKDLKATASRMGATGNITTGNIQNAEKFARAFTLTGSAKELLHAEKLIKGNSSGFIRDLGSIAKNSIKTEMVNSLQKWKSEPMKKQLLSGGKMILAKAESSLLKEDDFGTQIAGGVIATGMAGVATFKGAQVVSEIGIHNIKKVGNGVYQIATTAGKASITVGRTAKTIIQSQTVPIGKDAVKILKNQAKISGLNDTQIAKNIINKVNNVKTTYHTALSNIKQVRTTVISGTVKIKTAVDKSIKIVHGVANGKLTVNMAKTSVEAFRKKASVKIRTGIRKGAGYAVKGTATAGTRLVLRGVPKTGRFLKSGVMTAAGVMTGSDDYAVQGVGNALTAADIGIKTGVKGIKATKYTVKTAVKSGKAVYAGIQFIKNQGLRKAWNVARNKAMQKMFGAGRSFVTFLLNSAKLLGSKVLIPLILICIVATAIMGGISAPTMVVGTIFSETFSTSDANVEYNVRDYLMDAENIPRVSMEYKQELVSQMQNSKKPVGIYDIVRFYSNTGSADVVEPTLAGVTSVFPTNEELVNMLQPMFNAIILMKYELEPTERQAQALVDELFNGLFRITNVTSVEQCGQALRDGTGTVTTHECGFVHALDDCPNFIEGTHTTYTCDECDYYKCKGHQGEKNCGKSSHTHDESCYNATGQKICGKSSHTHDPWENEDETGCYTTEKHEGRLTEDCGNSEFKCDGFKNCNSHQVISYTLNLDGVYALTNKYFLEPIDQLSNINPRTEEQERKLQELKDYYQIFQEMMGQVSQEYGGGLSMSDISGVEFVNGTRVSNQSVIDLALSQVGQQGGEPYWSYYGFGSRVEWCACFVHWCMRNTPSASGSYPTTSNNAYCPTLANHFQSAGQWGNKDYTNLVAGDVIFFDWEGDGTTDHVGLVIGQDGNYVYTVEGNSGDAVKMKKYQISSSVIFGYGLMNY